MKNPNSFVALIILFVGLLLTAAPPSEAASTESRFLRLATDTEVTTTTDRIILSTTITLSQSKAVLVVADGRIYPSGPAKMPDLEIAIDGSKADSSQAVLDWVGSTNAVQHSFNAMAYRQLSAGTHTVQLLARNHPAQGAGRFKVGADTSLSIMVDPAPSVLVSKLGSDSQNIDLATNQPGIVIHEGDPRPMVTVASNTLVSHASRAPVVSLVSGRAYVACQTAYPLNTPSSTKSEGDAAWGIYRSDRQCLNNGEASWAANDLWRGAELHSPLYAHALHRPPNGTTLQLKVGELVFNDSVNNFENAVCYKVGANTQLISLYGMSLAGSAPIDASDCRTYQFQCVGTSIAWPGCPPVYSNAVLASTTIDVPQGHNGIVFFSAKTRVQGDPSDAGGNVLLMIMIDGVQRGSIGVQQLKTPDGASSRTLTASYLSVDGPSSVRLTPGTHQVQVVVRADGTFKHVSATRDLPLVYFD